MTAAGFWPATGVGARATTAGPMAAKVGLAGPAGYTRTGQISTLMSLHFAWRKRTMLSAARVT